MRLVNSSLLTLIPHLLLPDRIFQPNDDLYYGYDFQPAMPAPLDSFHEGETAMRSLLKVPSGGGNPTSAGLPLSYAMRVAESPLVAVGTLDGEGRPWTTLWGGTRGFAGPITQGVLGLNTSVDAEHDPVYEALWGDAAGAGGVVQPDGGRGKMMSALAIDLESRDRVKLMGMMVAGVVEKEDKNLQLAFLVTESLGNCPKYLNKKRVAPRVMHGEEEKDTEVVMPEEGRMMPEEGVRLLEKADMFFMSSTNGESMDTNHRGGAAGFVRVLKNEADEAVLVYPEYSGNRLYQTLGNLRINPLVGLVVPDFASSSALYLTGTTSILVGADAAAVMARTSLAVQITISAARFVRRGLPFRGLPLELSPYNPPVRHLLAERDAHAVINPFEERSVLTTATLTKREVLSPTVIRFTFTLEGRDAEKMQWLPGQHVTLDFGEELNDGYAHMRDDDPQSLNDDYVRTFTVSNTPKTEGEGQAELQITARRNGPATNLLWRQNLRVPLTIPVLGFGGEASFRLPTTTANGAAKPVYVAGGVGITPLLAQARGVLDAGVPLTLLWSLNKKDLSLAVHTLSRIDGLAEKTTIFVSGGVGADEEMVGKLQEQGVRGIGHRRVEEGDVKKLGGPSTKFYLCAGTKLLRSLQEWLDGETTVWEDFGY